MKEKKWIAICIVALVVLVMLNLPDATSARVKGAVRDGLSPLQLVASGGMREVREIIRYIRGLGDLAQENRALTEEVANLRGEVRRLAEAERDNENLRKQMGFRQRSARRLVACEVVGRDSTGWWQTARLDKGVEGGVAADRAVLTADGLMGRTVSASGRTADVLLLTDPSCKVSVQLAQTAVFGVLQGATGEDPAGEGKAPLCRMDYIPRLESVRIGDEVVTSGLGGIFPRGLLVGHVVAVESEEGGLYQSAWVELSAEMGLLEYAFVIATDEDLERAHELRLAGEGTADESGDASDVGGDVEVEGTEGEVSQAGPQPGGAGCWLALRAGPSGEDAGGAA